MVKNPVQQGPLKANVLTMFLALDPFMPQDLLPLGEKLSVERGPTQWGARIRLLKMGHFGNKQQALGPLSSHR